MLNKQLLELGLLTTSIGLVLSALAVFAAIPQLNYGIYMQAEPVNTALFVSSGIITLGLAAIFFTHASSMRALFNPIVLSALAVTVWSAASSLFSSHPSNSWFGAPQTGEGVLSYAIITIFIIAGTTLAAHPRSIRLVSSAFLVVAAVLLFVYWGQDKPWLVEAWISFSGQFEHGMKQNYPLPYYFEDYLAFYAIFLTPLVFFGFRGSRFQKLVSIAAGVISLGLVLVSENLAGYAAAFIFFPAAVCLLIFVKRKRLLRFRMHFLGAALAIGAGLTVTAAIFAIPIVTDQIGYEKLGLKAESLPWRTVHTLKSRYRLAQVTIDEIAEIPSTIIAGSGWGSFRSLLIKHIKAGQINLRDDYTEAKEAQGWDAVMRVDFHSHNFIFEGLSATGIIGALLILIFVASPVLWGKKKCAIFGAGIVGAFCITAAMWFQMAASLPFMGLAFAGFASRKTLRSSFSPPASLFAVGTMTLIGALLIALGINSATFALGAKDFAPSMTTELKPANLSQSCPETFKDLGRGGYHLGFRLRVYSRFVMAQANAEREIDSAHIEKLRGIICASEAYIDNNPSIQLRVADLLSRADLAFAKPSPRLNQLRETYLSNWKIRVIEAIKSYPERTDLAVSYLLWALSSGKANQLSEISGILYRQNPGDPVGLWFSGIVLSGNPKSGDEGVGRMMQALDLGIENIMPIDAELKKALGRPVGAQ